MEGRSPAAAARSSDADGGHASLRALRRDAPGAAQEDVDGAAVLALGLLGLKARPPRAGLLLHELGPPALGMRLQLKVPGGDGDGPHLLEIESDAAKDVAGP